VKNLAALPLHFAERRAIGLHRGLIDQRAHEDAGLERIADADLFVGRNQPGDHLLVTRLMNDEPPRGGAALASRAHGAEQNGPDGQVQIGALVHDDRVVAANSSSVRPSRPATSSATWRPTGTDPVNEISGSRASRTILSA